MPANRTKITTLIVWAIAWSAAMIASAILLKGNPIKDWIQSAPVHRCDDLLGLAVTTCCQAMIETLSGYESFQLGPSPVDDYARSRCKCENHIKIQPKVTIGSILSLNRRSPHRRALGYVLLLIISFGATMETVHSHGTGSPDRQGIPAFSDADGTHPSHAGHSHLMECPMCEFQQHLFNGLVQAPLFTLTPSTQIASISAPAVVSPSTSITRPSGRAPPLG